MLQISRKLSFLCLLTCCVLLQLPVTTNGAQILGLFSHPGKSHFDFFRPLFLGLAAAGHNLTIVSYFPNKTPVPNYTDIELTGMPILRDVVDLKNFEGDNFDLIPIKIPTFFMLHEWGMKGCEIAFKSDVIGNLLNSPSHYDMVILEQFSNDCMMAIAHLLNAPAIVALSSCAIMPWHYQRMSHIATPSIMPMSFLPHTDEMNFVQRINNFVHFHTTNLLYNYVTQRQTNALIQKYYGSDVPPIEELVKKTSLMLINQHFALTGAIPYPPSIVEVGGMQIQEATPLSKDLQELLDKSSNGVIYISWGSMIRPETLPLEKREAIFKSIKQFPEYTFLMRWNNDTLANKPKNLHTRSWMQQREILCHPNVKAFMTHGGLLGTSEAVYCGVPMLVTPFYGDQFLNSVAIEKRKLGVLVKYKDFNEMNINEALKSILRPSFSTHVKAIAESFKNRPTSALNLSIWWVEHLISHRGAATLLQNNAVNMSWFICNSFDIYLLITGIILITFVLVRICIKLLLRLFRNGKKEKIKLQ